MKENQKQKKIVMGHSLMNAKKKIIKEIVQNAIDQLRLTLILQTFDR